MDDTVLSTDLFQKEHCGDGLIKTEICFFKKCFCPHWKTCLLISERREGREREGEKHRGERETRIGCPLYAPLQGTKLAT